MTQDGHSPLPGGGQVGKPDRFVGKLHADDLGSGGALRASQLVTSRLVQCTRARRRRGATAIPRRTP